MKKYLMTIDPRTLKASKTVTITLGEDGQVSFEPDDAVVFHNQLTSVVVGGKAIRYQAGRPYFDALDRLCGTFFYVTCEDK